ncbi:Spectrin alpha chain, partial [Gryllus bimaculatus]
HAFGLAAGISSANRSDGVLIREGAATFVETCLLSVQIGDVRDVQLCICAFRSVPWRRVTFVLYPPPSPSALLWPGGLYRSCTFAESGEARRGEAARGVAWRGWRGAAMTAAGKDLQYYERFLFNDEREDVQKKTFAKWINSQLIKSNQSPVVDLFTDLRDGNRLLTLLEVLTGKTYKREKGRMRVHHLNNVNKALQILEQNNVKLVNISNNDIVDGNPKLTLGLVWSIILHWQVHYHLKHLMSDLQQTNLEKALLAWCRRNTKEYAGVDVRNFTTSWSDGLAFNALLHHWRPQLFDFNNIARKHPNARLEHAFRLAQEQLGIERLLDPEDVNTSVPDKKSIMMYVMCLFQSLPHTDLEVSSVDLSLGSETSSLLSPVAEGIGTVPGSRPLSLATNVSVELGSYQAALEEVLTWLLEAEDKLNNTPPVEGNLEAIKEQFYQHEDFLRELAGHQEGVRAVLEEGAHMVSEGGLSQDEEGEVRVQMRLLNSRWEDLRIKATNKQSQIHALLSERQQTQLDGLRRWLTATEDRMSHLAEEEQAGLGGLEGLKRRIEQHRELQQDLQRQQSVVDALKHMIVVVDDSCPENAYSQLEDQLTALGERWAHICQWAKERWSRLQNGHSAWMSLADDLARLQAWLDDRETALKQMEAQPAAEIGEVLGRIGKLQVLRREMEAQQKRITHLQEKASSLDGGGTELLEKLEILQDRWDALDQIMDVQGQRINNSGFDMSWTPLGDDPVSGDQILDGHWERTTTITTVTTNVVSNNQEMVQHSGSKKRRVGSASRQEFQSALQQHQVWLQHAEDTLHKGFTDLTVDEQQILLEEVTAEMQSRKPEKQRVQTLGQQLLDELMAEGESVSEERDLLTEVETKWSALQTLLEDQQRKVSFLKEKHQLDAELTGLQLILDGYQSWLDSAVKTSTTSPPSSPTSLQPSITQQLEQCRVKLKSMKSHEERVSRMKMKASELIQNEAAGSDAKDIEEASNAFVEKWGALLLRLAERQTELSNQLERTPPRKYLEAMEALTQWVHGVEGLLLSEHAVVAAIPAMQDQLHKFQELQKTIEDQQPSFRYVSTTGQELISRAGNEAHGQRLRAELAELTARWSDLPVILDERQKKLQKDIEMLRQFNDEVEGLNSWLQEVEAFLKAEEPLPVGDVDTLEAQLEQSNALQDDVETLQPNLNNIESTAQKLLDNADTNFAEELKTQLNAIREKWKLVVSGAKQQNITLKTTLGKCKKVLEGVDEFKSWLCQLETEIPAASSVTSSTELFQLKGKYQVLKDNIDKRTEEFRNLNEMGNDLMLSSESTSVQELARKFTQLNAKWTEVTDGIYNKHKILKEASDQYGEFRALVAQEMDWLDKLQKRLRKSPKSAADAEEISEELDDLENYIRNHPEARLAKIQEIGRRLVDDAVMPGTVQADVEALTQRWSQLSQQRLVEEFETQESTLREMEEQVKTYEAAGKHEAAVRLHEQMILLQRRFAEVQAKFERFKSPSNIEPRLNRAIRELHSIEEASCLLELASDDPEGIEGQLKHCLRFYRMLSDIKGEVECVIKSGRKLVEDHAVSEPAQFNARIDTLKELYNKLGSQITDAKTQLDNALELSRSLHSNLPQLSHWLDELDAHLEECDKAESSQDLEAGITYLRKALDEEIPQWNPVRDAVRSDYKKFSSLCDSVYLEALKDRVSDVLKRWDKVEPRLRNALRVLQDKLLKGETLHKEFTNILHEVKSSLQDAESKIKVLDAVPPNQLSEKHLAECKALQNDMILRKGQLDELRSSVQQIHSLDPSAEMQLADGDKQYNELWARIQNWSDKATILAKGHPETSRALDATKTQSLPSLPPPTPSRTPRGGSRGREEEQICNKTELTTSLSSKEASDQPQQTSNVSSSEQMEIDGVGYSNPAFDDSVLATTKLDSEGEEITCISRTVKRKVDIGVVPDLVPSVKTTESLWGQIQPQVKGEDDSTFRLAEDSVLFSQVSSNTLVPQTTKFEEHLREMPQSRIQSSLQDDSCRVVEIREMEIVKHAVYPRQSTDATIHYVSDTVEMVEIEDTETEPESATETDSEDKKSKTDDTKDSQSRKRDEVDDPSYDTVIPNKRLAKKSPTPQKKETDEEIIRVSPSTKVDVPIYPSTPASIENLLNETADTLTRAEPRKLILASPVAEKLVTPTPPPTPTACASDAPPPSLCLQMTDRVNKTEQMTVTAWRDAECTSNTCMPVAPRRRSLEEENRSKSSEVILKKEIEVSKTYKIIGNISDLQTQSLPTEKMIEEYESFYGSDKETDDVVEFSDDGVSPLELVNDSSSSEDDEGPSVMSHLLSQQLDKALLSSRKEAFAGKKEDKLQGSVKSPVAATRIPIRTVPASNKPITSSVAVATSATMSSFPAKATPQAAPRSSSSILRGTVPPLLEREILEFEQAAQQMLRRMDVMLVTVKGVSDEKDPVKRLELRKHQAQQAEEKLREFNYSVSALEPWLRDARRRLELANNDEGQLQQLQEEFEQKQKEFSELAEQSAELAALNVRHGEASVHDIQTRWQDVHDRFQHFKKEGLDKTKVVPDTKSTMDTNGTQTADFVTRVNKVREAVSTISRQLNSFPLSGRDYDGYQQQEEYLKRVKEGVAALKPSVDDIDRWLKCRDTWVSLHSNCQSFDDWLTNAESMITEWRSCDFPLAEAKIKQKELEKQVTMRTRTMSNMNMACREIISQGLCDHREYVECKLASLKRYTLSLDAIIAWNSVYDREMEVKEVLENYNNLEKECEGARQPVSVELQEKVKKLREDWHYVKSRGEVPITAQESIVTPSIKTVTSPPLRSSPLVTSNISSVKPVSSSPSVHAGERFVEG